MALSKAAKAALIAGGLYGLYRMLGSKQDGKDVPVEDRNTIRKTIAEADKKQDTKPAAAAAPSVKDKPTVKPASGETQSKAETARLYRAATPETPAAGAVKRASMAERKRGTAKQRARQDVMGTARLIDQGGRNAAAAASRAARKKESGLARADLAMGKDYLDRKQSELAGSRGAQILAAQDAALRASTMPNPKLASLAARRDGTRAMRDAAVLDRQRDARDAAAMQRFRAAQEQERYGMGMKKGGSVKKSRDGIAQRGKTKGRMC